MKANIHTHTFRCGHAQGKEREYIGQALASGLDTMGFSDHCPFRFPDGSESGFRVKCKDAPDYIETLNSLAGEYRGRIDIIPGFEMEYYPEFFDEMLSYVRSLGAKYLILGEHFLGREWPEGKLSIRETDDASDLVTYVDMVIEAMEKQVYSCVCHPDLINFTGDADCYEKEMRRLCRASVLTKTPLEINFLGIRDSRNYPNPAFWKIAGEEGCTAVFGLDAHNVSQAFCDKETLGKANAIASAPGLILAERIPLKEI